MMHKIRRMEIKLTLPLPPSVNSAFATNFETKRRFKSKEYSDWMDEASLSLLPQKKYGIKGDLWLKVDYIYLFPIYTKSNKKRLVDVFNYEKCLSDFLTHTIPGFADHKIKKGSVEKIDSYKRIVMITISEIPELESLV